MRGAAGELPRRPLPFLSCLLLYVAEDNYY